jgi:hypothetical protein
MSLRYRGGILSATSPTISISSASGFWNNTQQMQARSAGTWPIGVTIQSLKAWIGLLGASNTNIYDIGYGIAVDQSSGDVYVCGTTDVSGFGDYNFIISKFNTSGTLQWQRTIYGDSSSIDAAYFIALDLSGNVYVLGATGSNNIIVKYNTSGTLQWQRILPGCYLGGIAADYSGNVYVAGPKGTDNFILKYDTLGNLLWQRTLTNNQNSSASIAVDYSGNVYITGYINLNGQDFLIAKYDNNGNILWQRILGTGSYENATSIAVDLSGNVYVCGNNSNNVIIAKYDTLGNIQWSREVAGSGISYGYGISVDLSGNVYVCGKTYNTTSSVDNLLIVKYDTLGNLLWQRTLSTNVNITGQSIATDSSGSIHICGSITMFGGAAQDFIIAKLPMDGSLTATYSISGYTFDPIVYAASSLSNTSSLVSNSTSTLSNSASTIANSASTLSNTASTLIFTRTTIL